MREHVEVNFDDYGLTKPVRKLDFFPYVFALTIGGLVSYFFLLMYQEQKREPWEHKRIEVIYQMTGAKDTLQIETNRVWLENGDVKYFASRTTSWEKSAASGVRSFKILNSSK